MNILYISHLSTNIAAGLNWSVPASVNAQSKIDNVLWVNATEVTMDHWRKVEVYHNASEFGGLELSLFPAPFNKPDLVVFEGFYYMDDVKMGRKLKKAHIPYIIVVRGSLTHQAMHNHAWFKKFVAHTLFFNRFIRQATAIQYLTKGERDDSVKRFKTPYFIVSNGFDTPSVHKTSFSMDKTKAVFIGRLDMYHKGLDLLFDVITKRHEDLRLKGFELAIYGPRRYDFYKIGEEIKARNIGDIVCLNDEIGGKEKEMVLLDADVFIMTSRLEGHPMGLIEALAYGLPSLVTKGTNMKDEVEAEDAGWACAGDEKSIEEALFEMLDTRNEYMAKSERARKLAGRYQWDKLAAAFHNEVAKLI